MSSKKNATPKKETARSALVPKLRFPEFEGAGEWEALVFTDLYEFRPTNSLSRDQLSYDSGSAKNIHYGDIHTKYPTSFKIKEQTVPYVSSSYSLASLDASAYCQEGDMVFADASEDLADVGKSIELVELNGEKVLAGSHTILARQKNAALVIGFAGYLFKARGIRKQIEREAQGTKVLQISPGRLAGIKVCLPLDKFEQQCIADCLSSLDELITAQAQKVEALKTHKKGLMQQLFPREGETQPRLRFPEFEGAGEWEETSLGAVAHLRNGYAFKSAEYVDDGLYQIITIANVQHGSLTLESTKRIAALPSDVQAHQVLRLGDILTSMTGNVGRVCLVTADDLLLNQRVGKLIPESIEQGFFYQLLQRDHFRNAMQLKAAGGAQGNLSGGDIADYAFRMPTEPAEQQRIADCLSSLDELITAQAQKVEALKTHKKGLMQGLFPNSQEQNTQ